MPVPAAEGMISRTLLLPKHTVVECVRETKHTGRSSQGTA